MSQITLSAKSLNSAGKNVSCAAGFTSNLICQLEHVPRISQNKRNYNVLVHICIRKYKKINLY